MKKYFFAAALMCVVVCLSLGFLIKNNQGTRTISPKSLSKKIVEIDDVGNLPPKKNEGDPNHGSYISVIDHRLDIPLIFQENNYYCGPASLQMVLKYHDINVSQNQLASEMNTSPSTGTEYLDLARVANKYIFHNENVGINDAGYHVQTLIINDDNPEISLSLEERITQNVKTNDPTFVAVNTNVLYPEVKQANHFIVITGYATYEGTDNIAYFYYLDPYYVVENDEANGLQIITMENLVKAIITNEEPAYIW